MEIIDVFTDGGCDPNSGDGAWAAIIRTAETYTEISAYFPDTTNNRMEMQAAIEAIRRIIPHQTIRVHSDSELLVKGMSDQARIIKRHKRAAKDNLPNADLWSELDLLTSLHSVMWVWIQGHNGHPENERCDEMATTARLNRKAPIVAEFIDFGRDQTP